MLRRRIADLRNVGMDEKSFGRGHDYVSVLTDIDGSRVLDVVPGHDGPAAHSLGNTLSNDQKGTIAAVAMDMLPAFETSATTNVPQAAIVRIQSLKSAARGFRIFNNYRTRILFFCGKLNLIPNFTSH